MGEQPVADRRLGQTRLAEREVATDAGEDGGEHADHGDGQRPPEQRAEIVGLDALVDRLLDEEPDAHLGKAPGQPDGDAGRDASGARLQGVDDEPSAGPRHRVVLSLILILILVVVDDAAPLRRLESIGAAGSDHEVICADFASRISQGRPRSCRTRRKTKADSPRCASTRSPSELQTEASVSRSIAR